MFQQCKNCGKLFEGNSRQKFCTKKCRRYFSKHKSEIKNIFTEKKKTLDDWIREADACKMSYGKYYAAVTVFGKTFEELKANDV